MSTKDKNTAPEAPEQKPVLKPSPPSKEVGGRNGPEPTRYGDWEKKGIISDF